jgi:hypothetical protein
VIPAECPVCDGAGTLELGRAAIVQHGPDVAARSVEIALETAARYALADAAMTPETARAALRAAVTQLRTAGVLARTPGTPPPPEQTAPSGSPPEAVTLDAPPLIWAVDDRPTAAGVVGFSAAGYISRLAQVADPLDFMGPSTSQIVSRRTILDRQAATLAAAAATI